MRNFNRDSIVKPVALESVDCLQHLNNIIADPNIKAVPDYYKGKQVNANGTPEFTVRLALKSIYKNKCAYCEKQTHAPKIEHHRPKGKVVGTNNQNRGYYWLSYEWTNLLPSCTDCNAIDSKGSKYPIRGNRNNIHPIKGNPPAVFSPDFVYNVAFNTNEQPLLLHPEYCIPESNFDFDLNGKIYGTTQEGTQTVNIIKLDNNDLNGWRRKIYEDFFSEIENIVRKYFREDNPISENVFQEFIFDWTKKLVVQANNDELEYTLFRSFLLKKVDYFFIHQLDVAFRPATKAAISASLMNLSN